MKIDEEFIGRATEVLSPLVKESKERQNEGQRKWRKENPEKFKESQRKYEKTDKGRYAISKI